jgi:hypothetical protein
MVTYTGWLKTREKAEDRIGWYARYWARITPGRISSVTGVEVRLNENLRDARKVFEESGGDADLEQGVRMAESALEIHLEAVEAYNQRDSSLQAQAVADADKAGAVNGLATVTQLGTGFEGLGGVDWPRITTERPEERREREQQELATGGVVEGPMAVRIGEGALQVNLPDGTTQRYEGEPVHVQLHESSTGHVHVQETVTGYPLRQPTQLDRIEELLGQVFNLLTVIAGQQAPQKLDGLAAEVVREMREQMAQMPWAELFAMADFTEGTGERV